MLSIPGISTSFLLEHIKNTIKYQDSGFFQESVVRILLSIPGISTPILLEHIKKWDNRRIHSKAGRPSGVAAYPRA